MQPATVSPNVADMFNPSPFGLNTDVEALPHCPSDTDIGQSLPLACDDDDKDDDEDDDEDDDDPAAATTTTTKTEASASDLGINYH